MMLLLVIAMLTTLSSDWQYVTTSSKDVDYYVDVESIRAAGGYIQAWEKADYSKDPSTKAREAKILLDYDCSGRRNRLRASINYDARGVVIDSYTWNEYEAGWRPLAPDTVGYAKMEYTCRIAAG